MKARMCAAGVRLCSASLAIAFGAVCFAMGSCKEEARDDEVDTETETDDVNEHTAYEEACISACAAATSADECGAVAVEEDPDLSDAVLDCAWTDFAEASIGESKTCSFGDTIGKCFCTIIAEDWGGEDGLFDVPGCGEVSGFPAFVEQGGVPYFGLLAHHPLVCGSIHICDFDLEGDAVPSGCECFCDWPQDPDIACDYTAGICFDASTGLMWNARAVGYSPGHLCAYDLLSSADACDNVGTGGYTDWRVPTVGELRTLIRGCPQNGPGGDCPIDSDCADVSCAEAPCTECSLGGPTGTDDDCAYCAGFDEGPCAMCDPAMGPGNEGCYFPPDLDWPCGPYWTSTPATPIPSDPPAGYEWFVDFSVGAPEVTGEYNSGDDAIEYSAAAFVSCVRDD